MFLNLLFTLVGFLYYLPFVNRGIVLYDEGYYVHIADRILKGEVPYKDFFLQFPPLYFYVLSYVFKVFGEKIVVERVLTLFFCLLIIFINLKLADKLGIKSLKQKILVILSLLSFGFPLINNPSTLAWAVVLTVSFLNYFVIDWSFKKRNILIAGIWLAVLMMLKQNLGVYFFIFTNLFVILNSKDKFKDLLRLNLIPLLTVFSWVYVFFHQNWNLLAEFINFNRRYALIYPLSYPPLSFILNPVGIFKLIPYYLPIIYLLLFVKKLHKIKLPVIFFIGSSLIGFFGTVFPTSDLLHVYPFYSLILISGLLMFRKNKIVIALTIISIVSGLYLTLFREYYRYQPSYSSQNKYLDFKRAGGILIDAPLADQLLGASNYIKRNQGKNGYILVYPFSPMLYFLYEIGNPSKYSIYYPGYLTTEQEENVLKEISLNKTKYIITVSNYKFNTPISKFIQQQKEVYNNGIIKIFEII